MKSFFVTILIWAAVFVLVWRGFHELFYPPGDWVGALLASFFVALGIGAARKARIERRDAALVARADDAPRDGKRIALAGTLESAGELLHAPFSGAECVMYDYAISHTRTLRSGEATRVYDRSGLALAPTAIRAGVRSIRLLACPGLEGFENSPVDDRLREGARRYAAETQFEDKSSLMAIPDVASIMQDKSGMIRKDWKLSNYDGFDTLEERFVRPGEKVCVVGRYSAAENAIVPEANVGGVRLIRGSKADALELLGDSRLGDIIAAVLLILLPSIAIFGVLAWREHYFNVNGQSSVRAERRDAFLAAAATGDLETLAKTIGHGIDVNAVDANGDTALAKVPDATTAETLIAAGANVHKACHDGLTPLMLAAAEGRAEVVRVLIRHGANVNAFNATHRGSALSFAEENGHPDVAKILRDAGAR